MSRSASHRRLSWSLPLCTLALLLACKVHAQDNKADAPDPPVAATQPAKAAAPPRCLPDGGGYLRARLKGSIDTELDWGNENTECTGAVRPTDGGIRMRFTHAVQTGAANGTAERPDTEPLILVFGIAGLHEGESARALPVNVTVIREGVGEFPGEFYGTQGDDKCTLDTVTQTPIVGIPRRSRSYRVVARGFCTEPARAVNGSGAVLISRFDYAGRVDFETADAGPDAPVALTETTPP